VWRHIIGEITKFRTKTLSLFSERKKKIEENRWEGGGGKEGRPCKVFEAYLPQNTTTYCNERLINKPTFYD
jgi:hypothetical protein